jgi:hypothetical protein
MEKVFPVVRLRGLPFNANDFDILEFFQGLEPVDVLIVRRDGRTTGEAYVLFGRGWHSRPGVRLVSVSVRVRSSLLTLS